ncbi:phosphoglycolate phosphatase [Erysipelatoclostridium sp. An15]|uniref:HAD family hydrolase n=1 Tax=unclassified Thomasclavelia TaxID=3025756 RepID=UPI000B393199|nr:MULTISPECIES: HAD family hydrolase [unclassified Thomasclavelia]OUP73098.1 phosphoglycolate phosphatase [Erysipelatoclostridium sp. An173]OUQ07568.1 phosphoglycolate phosphatase [Erysipelatoclostridium sp. An15]
MKQKHILFDLDGTLTDPMMGITKSVRYALNYYGIEVNDLNDLLPFIGPPLRDSFKEYYGFDEAKANEAVEKYREYYKTDGIFDNKVYQGMVECLQTLKDNGKKLYVATSKPEFFAKQIIEHFSLSKYFEYVGGSEFNSREKKAEVIEYVLKTNQIDNDDVIMVGDRKHDIIGAHENKIPCVGVLYGYGTEDELKQYQADYLVASVEELTELLK